MAKLVVVFHNRANSKLNAQAQWYHENKDDTFTRTMMKNIMDDIDAICETPTIGRSMTNTGRHQYRVFVSKKNV